MLLFEHFRFLYLRYIPIRSATTLRRPRPYNPIVYNRLYDRLDKLHALDHGSNIL